MDLMMQALNVTIYGLGIVFLALLVLMFSIMVLSRIFEAATGKQVFSAVPAPSRAPAPAPAPAAPSPTVEAASSAAQPAAVQAPQPAPAVVGEEAGPAAGEVLGQITAPLPGKVLSVAVKPGDSVKKGDEVCVIEAMKMGNSIKSDYDGIVSEVLVSVGDSVNFGAPLVAVAAASRRAAPSAVSAPRTAAAPAAPAAAPSPAVAAPSSFKMGVQGTQHQAEVKPGAGNTVTVVIDGKTFEVERDQADPRRIVVGGKAHTVEVKEAGSGSVTVVVDGVVQQVELGRVGVAAAAAAVAPAFAPGAFKMAIGPSQHQVEIKNATETSATVVVDGATYKVERGKLNSKVVVVNGEPIPVEVRERTGSSVGILVDGAPKSVQVWDVKAATPPQPAPAAAPAAPAPSAPAPAPAAPAPVAPAAPAPAAAPAPSAGPGEQITAPLPGKVLSVAVKAGDAVRKGDEVCVIEAMKMGNSIRAQRDGTIQDVLVSPGDSVAFGTPLFVIG